jgi:uncharacterized protein YyaL (SSP411 family)
MNRLSREISPYLLQHAENPVAWEPWGAEALDRARREQKPIFLSIGYSACHWCHVMAHESFEDAGVAELLNNEFVSIKVDREERPDLDQVYMEAVQAMTGHGGWPMSVFLTPDVKPFFGGTYWPKNARGGMAGFRDVALAVAAAWRDRREDVLHQAEQAVQFLQRQHVPGDKSAELTAAPLEAAETGLLQAFDARFGGFGGAPKFPHAIELKLLLKRWQRAGVPPLGGSGPGTPQPAKAGTPANEPANPRDDLLEAVTVTLDRMAAGGIYDQLGGGFHRYSVDDQWLVPHFEKMLYDNAMLADCYLAAWQTTKRDDYRRVVRETLDYVLRDMTDARGGFYSAEDADSEGEEGKFYVWTPAEVETVLGHDRAAAFGKVYDVSAVGNFEGSNILHLSKPIDVCAKMLGRELAELKAELADDCAKLLEARSKRVRPGRDDKVLVSWNGLMIEALARAGAAFGEPRYGAAAAASAGFLLSELRDGDGRLLHCWRAGQARHHAFLDDHASLCNALITLHETMLPSPSGRGAGGEGSRWLDEAVRLADAMLALFQDAEGGGFFYTPSDHEPLITRKKDVVDSPVPSSTGLAVMALLRLSRHTGREDYAQAAEETLRVNMELMSRASLGDAQLLLGLDDWLSK